MIPTGRRMSKTIILAQYPRRIEGGTEGEFFILQVDAQKKETSKLPGASGMFAPRWSPDGRYISTFSADDSKLMLLDLKTGKWSELTAGKILQFPNWSPDSKYVYYEDSGSDSPELNRVNIADRKKERLNVAKHGVSFRDAAYRVAVDRVARATEVRGIYP